MLRVENEATPDTGATFLVPDRTPPGPALFAIATVTLSAYPAAVFPYGSWTVTCTAGLMALPAAALAGWIVKASCEAGAAVMLKLPLTAWVRPVAVALSAYPVA